MNNTPELRAKIDKWFAAHTDKMLEDLGKLIAINSVRGKSKEGAPYGEESRAALSLVQNMLETRGFEVSLFEDMMITANLGPTPTQLGILAHLDIVAPGEGWDTDPLKLTVKDGVLYGRGVIDNKGPAIAAMYAMCCVRELYPNIESGVQLLLGTGEETGCDDIAQYRSKHATPPNVFTPDADFPVVNIEKGRFMPVFGAKWEKDDAIPKILEITGGKTPNVVPNYSEAVVEGFTEKEVKAFCSEYTDKTGVILSAMPDGCDPNGRDAISKIAKDRIKITAEGTAAHASLPERGNNAQTAILEMLAVMPFAECKGFECIRALNRLFQHGDHNGAALGIDMSDETTGRMTVNFGVLRYSEYEFSGNFDSRTPLCADEVDLIAMTRSALERKGMAITYHEIMTCHHTPAETPFIRKLLRIYEEYTGKPGECVSIGGLSYAHGIPGGVAFGCEMPGEYNNVHNANEFISLEQLITCAKMFTHAILDMCSQ